MNSRTSERFRLAFGRLPARVQRRARAAYRLFQRDPSHPSLRFCQVHPSRPIYSVRIGLAYRALGVREADEIIWFWIGPHADYDQRPRTARRHARAHYGPAELPQGARGVE